MNKVYKLIWNRALGMLIPVPESATALGRGRLPRRVRRKLAARARKVAAGAIPLGLILLPLHAAALPVGGQVVSGQASLQQPNADTLNVNQSSQNAIINWQGFGVGAGQTVNFRQPGASAVVLNRVLGTDSSAIYGHINANGQVFLVNPNGVYFAPGAQVSVGGLVVSTHNISDQDFNAGNDHFTGSSPNGVVNKGSITAAPGGYVAFIGATVDNEGRISTPGGTTALGAGGTVDLSFAGNSLAHFQVSSAALRAAVKNGGAIVAPNGTVILSAQARDALLQTVVNNSGVVQAQGVRQQGGVIQLLGGDSGSTVNSGTLDASSDSGVGGTVQVSGPHVVLQQGTRIIATGSVGGGTIAVGGGVHGAGPLPQAVTTTVDKGAVLDASATVKGDGGKISVWSAVGNPDSVTRAQGTFLAQGGPGGGDGGFVETSGHTLDVTGAAVNASAPAGRAGSWLLDPYNVTIASNNNSGTAFSSNYTPTTASVILNSSIDTALNAGTGVTITTGAGGSSNGDIAVDAPISWNTSATLQLNAAGNIAVNAAISATGSTPTLQFFYGQSSAAGTGASYSIAAPVNLSSNAGFQTKLGSSGAAVTYTVIDTMTQLQAINSTGLSGNYVLGNNLVDSVTTGPGFTPIASGSAFTGVFDGLGHTLSGLYINTPSNSYVGLFDTVGHGGVVRNIGLVGGSVTGGDTVGGLAGWNSGTISNAYATGRVTGVFTAGGLVGTNAGTINDVYATGSVTGIGHVGGLVGHNTNGTVSHAYATGSVSGRSEVGGLVGSNTGTINDVYATGSVTGSDNVGGLVGSNNDGTISNVYATGSVSGNGTNVGGLVGDNLRGTISDAYATGSVSGGRYVGGLIGSNHHGTVSDAYATGGVSGSSDVGGLVGSNDTGTISDAYATGSVSGSGYIGGLVGNNPHGTISDAYATGSVTGSSNVGGLVGSNSNGTVTAGYWNTATSGIASIGIGGGSTTGATGLTTAALAAALPTGFDGTVWANGDNQTTPYLLANASFGTVGGEVYLGSDGSATPVQYGVVQTMTQLQDINSTGLALNYVLGNNLTDSVTTGPGFTPIGNSNTAFTGVFDGLGHTLSGLYIDTPSDDYVGLFGFVGSGGIIRDIGLVGGTVTGRNTVGGLVGLNAGTIRDAYATGSVSGSYYVGGLVGSNDTGTISEAFATGSVTGSEYVGGLVGYSSNGTIGDAYATGRVSGAAFVGGLVGSNYRGTISDVYATGSISAGIFFGGLVGANNGTVSDGYWDITTSGLTSNGIGGGSTNGATGRTTAALAAALPAGFDGSVWANGDNQTTPYLLANASFNTIGGEVYLGSDGSATPVQYGVVQTMTQLQDINSTGLALNYVLGNNLTDSVTTGPGFTPIGNSNAFTGVFDGLGHTLSGLYIDTPSDDYVGLFGVVGSGGVVRDIGLVGGSVTGSFAVGELVGYNSNGTVSDAYATGSVSGSSAIGGLVGINAGGTISDAYATGRVTGNVNVGGLVGSNFGTISDAYTTGSVTGFYNVGGLVGTNFGGMVSDAYATGSVSGDTDVGGLVGANGGAIGEAYATGGVTGSLEIGGLVGNNFGTIADGYWDITTSIGTGVGSGTATGAIGLTTAALAAALPTGFDGSVWANGDNQTTPYLLANASFNTIGGEVYLGSDSSATPVQYGVVQTLTQLQAINSTGLSHNYVLGNNLTDSVTTGPGFTPIGNSNAFTGVFDGLGHTLAGLYIDAPGNNNVGLFGVVGGGGIVRDIGLVGGSITGADNVGALVGGNFGGTVSNAYATGSVTGSTNVGGLVGRSYGGTIRDVYATGNVTGSGNVGGLVGDNIGAGAISNAYATGSVSGGSIVGGLVGVNSNGGTIGDAYATGSVSGNNGVGGLVGYNRFGTISDAYATGSVSGGSIVGGLVGYNTNGTVTDGYWDITTSGIASNGIGGGATTGVTGLSTAALAAALPGGFDGSVWANGDNRTTPYLLANASFGTVGGEVYLGSDGSATPTQYGVVQTMTQLQAINSTGLALNYVLGNNLVDSVTTGPGFTPIGNNGSRFTGVFDGLGHTLSGLYINRPSSTNVGLFGVVGSGGIIRDIGLVGGSVTGYFNVGALAGSNAGGTISDAYATGSVSGSDAVGGLVGANVNGTISDVYATGSVRASIDSAGGLVAVNVNGTISDAYATGNVSSSENIGGLVGTNYFGTISNVYATGSVSGTNSIGGLLGNSDGGTINNAYATGSVSGESNVGGLAGYNINGSTISDAYATGSVSGESNVGGLVGWNSNGATVRNVYAIGSVTGSFRVGGLVGSNYLGTVTDGYWDTATSGNTGIGGGTTTGAIGLNASQMQQQSSFAGFDFSSPVWVIYDGHTAPLLNVFLTPLTIAASNQSATYNGAGSTLGLLNETDTRTGNAPGGTLFGNSGSIFGQPYIAAVNVGTYGADLWSDQQGYRISVTNAQLTITPKALTASIVGDPTKTYDGTNGATLSDANYSISGFVTGQGASVSQTSGSYASANAGTNDIVTASLTGTDFTAANGTLLSNYVLPTTASGAGTIARKALSASIVGDPTKTYDGTDEATLSAANYSVSGFVTGQGASVSQTFGNYASANAGTNDTVTASLTGANFIAANGTLLSNYVLPVTVSGAGTIARKALSASIIGDPTKTYDGTDEATLSAANYSVSGFITGQGASVSQTSGSYASANAGTNDIVTALLAGTDFTAANGTLLSNYMLPTTASGAGTIARKALSASIVGDPTKTYDGTNAATLSAANYSVSGFVTGQGASVSQTSGSYASANAGTNDIVTASLTGANFIAVNGTLLSNYVLPTTASGVGTIARKALSASIVGDPTKTYNGTDEATLSAANYSVSGFVTGQGASVSQTFGNYASANAGTNDIVTVSLTGANFIAVNGTLLSNYVLPTTVNGAGTITPKALSASIVGDPTKIYDGTDEATLSAANYSVSGFVTGQGASVSQTSGSYASANAGTNDIVTASLTGANFIAANGTLLSNYVLPVTASGAGTITQKVLSASIIGDPTKTYDGTDEATLSAANYSINGFVTGQGASVSQTFGNYALANAGTNVIVTASLTGADFIAANGTLLSNYVLPVTASGVGTITQKVLSASIIGDPTKTYDGTDAATLSAANYSVSGFVAGQGASETNLPASGTYASANAGTNDIVTVSLTGANFIAANGTLLSNYVLPTTASGAGAIARKALSASIVGNPTKIYDGTTEATLSAANYSVSGFVTGQGASVSQTSGSYASANAGTNDIVTASLTGADFVAAGGTLLGNYVLPVTAIGAGTITPKSGAQFVFISKGQIVPPNNFLPPSTFEPPAPVSIVDGGVNAPDAEDANAPP
ncbi:MAG: GLUG motif-containing protein [Rhizomicrobium sp.]